MRSKKGVKAGLKEAALILMIVSLIAVVFNQLRLNGLSLVRDRPSQADSPTLFNISLDEAIHEFEEGRAIFVDGRSRVRYQNGHIPRALSMPYDSFYERLPAVKGEVSSDGRVITYDEGREFHISVDLAHLLQESGFKDVRVFRDGWSQWKDAGLPVEKDRDRD